MYWQFLEYPDWFRVRQGGLRHFLQIKTSDVLQVPGGISGVTTLCMRKFWPQDEGAINLRVHGVRVTTPRGMSIQRCVFGVLLADEAAEKK